MLNQNFPYNAEELSAFILSIDTFIISLKNGQVVKHATEETEPFYNWLVSNNVRDISKQRSFSY
jgi:sRNA-binding regulator protein Hfq